MRAKKTERTSLQRGAKELAERRQPMDWRELVGKIQFYEGYDPKELSPVRGFVESVGAEEDR